MYKNHTHMEESRDFLFCHVTDSGRNLRKRGILVNLYVIENTEIGYSRSLYTSRKIPRLDIPEYFRIT